VDWAARSVYPLDAGWLPAMGGIAAASHVAGVAVPFAPAGIGAREGLMTLLLSTLMPASAATVTSVLYRVVSILAELATAGFIHGREHTANHGRCGLPRPPKPSPAHRERALESFLTRPVRS